MNLQCDISTCLIAQEITESMECLAYDGEGNCGYKVYDEIPGEG